MHMLWGFRRALALLFTLLVGVPLVFTPEESPAPVERQISCAEDLLALSTLSESGHTFVGETILLTAGTQIRDFVYVEDVLDNLMALVSRQDLPEYLDLPLGSGEGVSIRELVTYLKEMLHSDSQLCFGAVPSRMNEPDSVADRETMQRFGVSIRYGWKEGMKKFL